LLNSRNVGDEWPFQAPTALSPATDSQIPISYENGKEGGGQGPPGNSDGEGKINPFMGIKFKRDRVTDDPSAAFI